MATAGTRIDRFTLVRQLGAGGMGSTWEAVRQVGSDFEQRVAIKLAAPELLSTTDGLASFRREAALAASLRHPNIAAVLDVDEQAGYIVCELVDGADLRSVLRTVPGGRLHVPVAVHLVAQIARGLGHAHRRILRGRPSPVIHRDMTPANVVVDYDGNVKIVDFGIAKVLASGVEVAESVKGKLSYMAPEQAMGGRMDGRVDQYALGVIAYEALSGVRPNDGAHEGETLGCILEGRHVPLQERVSGLPKALCRCVERMLALRPEDRFTSMDALLDALAEFTPKLTVHRELVPLVVAARQPHTILRENGRYVSRPVEAHSRLRDVSVAMGEAPLGAELGLNRHRDGGEIPRTTLADDARSHAPQRLAALAVTVGNTRSLERENPAPAQQPAPAKAAPPALPPPIPKQATSTQSTGTLARRFWQGMTGAGALLLIAVIWVALSPDALRLLGIERDAAPAGQLAPISVTAANRDVPGAIDTLANQPVSKSESSAMGALEQASARDRRLDAGRRIGAAREGLDRAPGETNVHSAIDPAAEAAPAATSPQARAPVSAAPRSTLPARSGHDPGALAAPAAEGRSAPAPVDAAVASRQQSARIRVRVKTAATVWLDDQRYGEADPELELKVTPGTHVVGVGAHAQALVRRTVEVAPGDSQLLQFDRPDNR